MLEFLEDTWGRIQNDLRDRAGEAAYSSWLAELRPLALERSVCYFEAENRMAAERVQRLFTPLLHELLSHGMGTTVTVDIAPRPESLMTDVLEVSPTRPVVDDSNRTAFLVLKSLLEQKQSLPGTCLLYTSPSPRDGLLSRMPSSA